MRSSQRFNASVLFAVSLFVAETISVVFMGLGATTARAQAPLPNIVEQFQKIQHSGAGLAFRLGVGFDPGMPVWA